MQVSQKVSQEYSKPQESNNEDKANMWLTLPLIEAQKVLKHETLSCVVVLRGLNKLPQGGLLELISFLSTLVHIEKTIVLPVRRHLPRSSRGNLKERPASTGFIVVRSAIEAKLLLARGHCSIGDVDIQITEYQDKRVGGGTSGTQENTVSWEGNKNHEAKECLMHPDPPSIDMIDDMDDDDGFEFGTSLQADSVGHFMYRRSSEDTVASSTLVLDYCGDIHSEWLTRDLLREEMMFARASPHLLAPVLCLPQYGFTWNG